MSDIAGLQRRAAWLPVQDTAMPEASSGLIRPAAGPHIAAEAPDDMSVPDGDLVRRYIACHGEIPLSTRHVIDWWLAGRR